MSDTRDTERSTGPEERTLPTLRWLDGAEPRSHAIDETATLGAAPSCDVVLPGRTVSRVHAELARRPDGLWLRDLGSRNGSYVQGIRVEIARIPHGATVRFGDTECEVSYERDDRPAAGAGATSFGPLVGASPPMQRLFALLARAAASDAGVLVQAETGSGKELVARALHDGSARRDEPFVIVDCAALPENLLESELFGHARGAFTGAVNARSGAFEDADKGTLFLDEIGELPLAMQPKLLRVLESRTIRRLGETSHRPVDVRVVAATHRDLRTMVNAGTFREDLYFRLAVLPVSIPPLRERVEDLPLLLERFLGRPAREVFGSGQLAELHRLPWLGNVRELRNFCERVKALGVDGALQLLRGDESPPPESRRDLPAVAASAAPALAPDVDAETLHAFRERWAANAEHAYLRALLGRYGDNLTEAAKRAGIARGHIYRLITRYDG